MSNTRPFWLRGLDYGGPGATLAAGFYRDLWGLAPVAEGEGHAWFRASGPEPYVLGLHDDDRKGLKSINFGLPDRPAMEALLARIGEKGAQIVAPIPPASTSPGALRPSTSWILTGGLPDSPSARRRTATRAKPRPPRQGSAMSC